MAYLKPIGLNLTDLNDSKNVRLVSIERQQYEYVKRLLLLYKANLRQTGECHYSPLLDLIKNKKL